MTTDAYTEQAAAIVANVLRVAETSHTAAVAMLASTLRAVARDAELDAIERPPPPPAAYDRGVAQAFLGILADEHPETAGLASAENVDDLAGLLGETRRRGRDELAPLLRRAVGIVSDLDKLRDEVRAVLDAFAGLETKPPADRAKPISASKVVDETTGASLAVHSSDGRRWPGCTK